MSFRALELSTADLERARRFWKNIMGLEELSSSPNSVTLAVGETHWTLTQASTPSDIAHFAFNVPENRFDDAVAWLRARVALLASPEGEEFFDFTNWSAHAVYFTDPDGNIAELIARHTLPSSRRESFELLGISEIGLVTDDVAEAALALGLPTYQSGHRTFRPVGDENGLIIIVETGRLWYPDNRHPARSVPFFVTLANGMTFSNT